eukprot:17010-Heterococcus_DN1.PRE.1
MKENRYPNPSVLIHNTTTSQEQRQRNMGINSIARTKLGRSPPNDMYVCHMYQCTESTSMHDCMKKSRSRSVATAILCTYVKDGN